MTYTTEQAIQMAREVGIIENIFADREEITALCNAVRKQTLLEAAEYLESSEFMKSDEHIRNMYGQSIALRRMADNQGEK